MFTKTNARQAKLFTGLAGVAALTILTGCAADDTSEQPPADQEVEQTVQPDDASPEPTEGETTEQADDADETATSGDDPVYDVIEAVENEYDGGFIVDIDLDDGGSQYEVDVVVDSELYELDVAADGSITVDDREGDDDSVAEAEQATVTVTEALDQAFQEHADASFDQIELEEDDGSVNWEIDLDGPDGNDIELDIPATN